MGSEFRHFNRVWSNAKYTLGEEHDRRTYSQMAQLVRETLPLAHGETARFNFFPSKRAVVQKTPFGNIVVFETRDRNKKLKAYLPERVQELIGYESEGLSYDQVKMLWFNPVDPLHSIGFKLYNMVVISASGHTDLGEQWVSSTAE